MYCGCIYTYDDSVFSDCRSITIVKMSFKIDLYLLYDK